MKKVRIGVIGVGGMGQGHCGYMHEVGVGELTAVCDIVPEVAETVGRKHQVPFFVKSTDLLDSGLVDAVLIATPHYFHPPIAVDAFKRGIHVLSEKPIGVSVKEASRMIRAAFLEQRKAPVRFPSMILFQAASSVSITEAVNRFIPTLLMRISRPPNRRTAVSKRFSTSPSRATWAGMARSRSPPPASDGHQEPGKTQRKC